MERAQYMGLRPFFATEEGDSSTYWHFSLCEVPLSTATLALVQEAVSLPWQPEWLYLRNPQLLA